MAPEAPGEKSLRPTDRAGGEVRARRPLASSEAEAGEARCPPEVVVPVFDMKCFLTRGIRQSRPTATWPAGA